MLKLILTLTLLATPAMATTDDTLKGIPTYRYFYSCNSGVVDCVNFDRNNTLNGDFGWGLNPGTNICSQDPSAPACAVIPTNWPAGASYCWIDYNGPCYGGFRLLMSNKEGDVLGYAGSTTGDALTYGSNGQLTCLFSCNDANWGPGGINDNGLYVFFTGINGYIGYGSNEFASLIPGGALDLRNFHSAIYDVEPRGINDANQILVKLDTPGPGGGMGVLSPTELDLPEPSGLILLATVVCFCIVLLRRKRRAHP